MPKFQKHIFICTNTREEGHPRGSCDSAHTGELLRAFKTAVSVRGLKGKVRANKAGCMDQCEHGPTVVVYPEAVWYGHVQQADVDEIVESHVVGGKPVERLIIPDECLNADCEHKKDRK